jgi:hypothetical protein
MKRLPPPNNNKPTKKSNGSSALVTGDYFKRFEHLVWCYDCQVEAYAKELLRADSSHAVRCLLESTLRPISDEERGDSLAKLWPDEKNIYLPSRAFYVQRLGLLVGSFPSAAPHSPKVYTGMLVSRVAVKEPSCMVLESACNELVDSYKYSNAPNIADLLSLIDKHEKLWEKRLEIDDEIQSGRARKRAEGRLAYEEEREQRKVERAITSLMKLKLEMRLKSSDPMMLTEVKRIKTFAATLIVELRESGIDALDEDNISELQNDARRLQEQDEKLARDQDPKFIAIVAFLKLFNLHEWHHDELAKDIYKEAIPASVVDAVARGIRPNTLRHINDGLADNYGRTIDFIKKTTFKTLHEEQARQNGKTLHEEEPRQNDWTPGTRIRF